MQSCKNATRQGASIYELAMHAGPVFCQRVVNLFFEGVAVVSGPSVLWRLCFWWLWSLIKWGKRGKWDKWQKSVGGYQGAKWAKWGKWGRWGKWQKSLKLMWIQASGGSGASWATVPECPNTHWKRSGEPIDFAPLAPLAFQLNSSASPHLPHLPHWMVHCQRRGNHSRLRPIRPTCFAVEFLTVVK